MTDTILPYSLYKHVEKDFKGRLERIDSYNKETDVFVTLQIIPRKEWDEEAKDWLISNQPKNNLGNLWDIHKKKLKKFLIAFLY